MTPEQYKTYSEQRLRKAQSELKKAEAKVFKFKRIVDDIDLSFREYVRDSQRKRKGNSPISSVKEAPKKEETPIKPPQNHEETPVKPTENKPKGLFDKFLDDLEKN